VHDHGAPQPVRDRHGDAGAQAQAPAEERSGPGEEGALLDQLDAAGAGEGGGVVHVEAHGRARVAGPAHVPVPVGQAGPVGGVEDELAAREAVPQRPDEGDDVVGAEVLEEAGGGEQGKPDVLFPVPRRQDRCC